MILIPCPVRPDLDCLAGAIGYAEYLRIAKNQNVKAWLCGIPDGEAQFYLDLFKDNISFASSEEITKADNYILVDFSTVDFFPEPIDRTKVIEVIDHRFFNDPQKEFPNARVQLDVVGAAATQIAEFFIDNDYKPQSYIAAMLYGAIFTHTLCANGSLCTDRDRRVLAWLKDNFSEADSYVNAQLQERRQEIIINSPHIFATEMKNEIASFGRYGISQIEIIDANSFWQENSKHIIEFLNEFDYPVCLNLIDLSNNSAVFYYSDSRLGNAVKDNILILSDNDNVLRYSPALMRKQIIPFIKDM